ncbi:ABC transporter permease [Thermococcus sp.]
MIGIIAEKEFRDYITGRRFILLLGFLLIVTLLSIIQVKDSMTTWGYNPPGGLKIYNIMWGVTHYMSLVGGIFAIALGFDAITKEKEGQTLKVLMSHPVYRDQIILGKLIGGALALGIAVIVTAVITLGIVMSVGITVDKTSAIRFLVYFFFVYLYLLLFFAMAVAFSVFSRTSGNALMWALILFLTVTIIFSTIAPIIAHHIAGEAPKPPEQLSQQVSNMSFEEMKEYEKKMKEYENKSKEWQKKYYKIMETISDFSPEAALEQISMYVMNPYMRSPEDIISSVQPERQKPKEYSISESLSFVKKEITFLIAYLVVSFVVAYFGFVKAEIR